LEPQDEDLSADMSAWPQATNRALRKTSEKPIPFDVPGARIRRG